MHTKRASCIWPSAKSTRSSSPLTLQHLNTIIYGLKGLLGDITGCDDHRRILSRFFDDFVERILVQDYKRLKTRNNPFRANLDRRRIDPKRIASYLERQLAGRRQIDGAAMTIAGVEDFIAFTHVRHLDYLPGAGHLSRE